MYILVKETLTVENGTTQDHPNNFANKKVILKNCKSFTNRMSIINNTEVDNSHDICVVMPMYNLIEYSNNSPKISGILWQYCRDELAEDANNASADFTAANATIDSFKIKDKMIYKTGKDGTKKLK